MLCSHSFFWGGGGPAVESKIFALEAESKIHPLANCEEINEMETESQKGIKLTFAFLIFKHILRNRNTLNEHACKISLYFTLPAQTITQKEGKKKAKLKEKKRKEKEEINLDGEKTSR